MYRNEGFKERGGGFAPVHVGEEVDVKIEAVGEKGDGIAKVKGFVLFVPNTKQGDEVKVKVTKVLRKVGFAEVVGQAGGKHAKHEKAEKSTDEDAESADEESSDTDDEFTEDSEEFGNEEK